MKKAITILFTSVFAFTLSLVSCQADADSSTEDLVKAAALAQNSSTTSDVTEVLKSEYTEITFGGLDIGSISDVLMVNYVDFEDSYYSNYDYSNTWNSSTNLGTCKVYIWSADDKDKLLSEDNSQRYIIGKKEITVTANSILTKETKFDAKCSNETEADSATGKSYFASYSEYSDTSYSKETSYVEYNPSDNYSVITYRTAVYGSNGLESAKHYYTEGLTFDESNKTVSGTLHEQEVNTLTYSGTVGMYDKQYVHIIHYPSNSSGSLDFTSPSYEEYYMFTFAWSSESSEIPRVQICYSSKDANYNSSSELTVYSTVTNYFKNGLLSRRVINNADGMPVAVYNYLNAKEPDVSGKYYVSMENIYVCGENDTYPEFLVIQKEREHIYVDPSVDELLPIEVESSEDSENYLYMAIEYAFYGEEVSRSGSSANKLSDLAIGKTYGRNNRSSLSDAFPSANKTGFAFR